MHSNTSVISPYFGTRNQPFAAQVTVVLDEAKLQKDVLHLFVTEGDDITVPLSATGQGHVVTCPAIADGVDFGPQFTGAAFLLHQLQSTLQRQVTNLDFLCAAASQTPEGAVSVH